MMTFSKQLQNELKEFDLLTHPFYQAWNEGKLEPETLRFYARQYLHHVKAFPRYVSATHSQSEDIQNRQILLENLIDEERGSKNHPELWMQFAEGLGQSRNSFNSEKAIPEIENVIRNFMTSAYSSFEEGLGALFAYEHQIPKIAETKIQGLKKFYGISAPEVLEFFEVHRTADEYHTEAVAGILDSMPMEQQEKARAAAKRSAKALWDFLSGICERSEQDFSEFCAKVA